MLPLDLVRLLAAEPLHLAYRAMHILLPLSPFAGGGDLTMEKLWYQIIARSVDLREFTLGLRASASLQLCLGERYGDVAIGTGGDSDGAVCLTLPKGGEAAAELLRLRPFGPLAGAGGSLDVAKVVSGASLNACRCCLEVGSRETLRLMAGELGRSAGVWIDTICELGDGAKAGECCSAPSVAQLTRSQRYRQQCCHVFALMETVPCCRVCAINPSLM